jgi:hypothetical protein
LHQEIPIMRLSSIVALFVVTASLALGGCAADAESSSSTDENVAPGGGALEVDRMAYAQARPSIALQPSWKLESDRAFAKTKKPSIALQPSRNLEAHEKPSGSQLWSDGPRVEAEPPVKAAFNTALSPEEMVEVVDEHTAGTTKP